MKKTSFVAIGILLLGSALAVAKTTGKSSKSVALKDGQRFDDWSVSCEKVEGQKDLMCHIRQSLSVKESQQVLAEYRIGYFGADKLKMVQILPADINIPSGTSLIVDKEILAPGSYNSCQGQFCIAASVIDQDIVKKMSKASEVYVAFINSQGKQVNSVVSAKGLDHAVKALSGK